MLGGRSTKAVGELWSHFLQFEEWKHHPVFSHDTAVKERLLLSLSAVEASKENLSKLY